MRKFALALLALTLTGCVTGTREIGRVGDTTYHAVRHQSFSGPNVAGIVALKDGENTPSIVTTVGGAGIGNAVIGAGGIVGGAAVFGGAIRPSTTSVSSSANSTGGNATGGTANSNGFVPPGHQDGHPGNGH